MLNLILLLTFVNISNASENKIPPPPLYKLIRNQQGEVIVVLKYCEYLLLKDELGPDFEDEIDPISSS